MQLLRMDTSVINKIAFVIDTRSNIEVDNSMLKGSTFLALLLVLLRYSHSILSSAVTSVLLNWKMVDKIAVMGYTNAELLFEKPENAIGKRVKIKKQGSYDSWSD
jgi:hypothetical protein